MLLQVVVMVGCGGSGVLRNSQTWVYPPAIFLTPVTNPNSSHLFCVCDFLPGKAKKTNSHTLSE